MARFLKFIGKTLLTFVLLFAVLVAIAMCKNDDKSNNETEEEKEHVHSFYLSSVIEEATCTENGKAEYACNCGETKEDVVLAEHDISNGVCQTCKKGIIDITFPDTPVVVSDSLGAQCKVTEIEITEISEYSSFESTYTVYISLSGECVKNSWSSSITLGYKLYDSEGYVIDSSIISLPNVSAGEKFRGAKFYIHSDQLNKNDTYTFVFENQTN